MVFKGVFIALLFILYVQMIGKSYIFVAYAESFSDNVFGGVFDAVIFGSKVKIPRDGCVRSEVFRVSVISPGSFGTVVFMGNLYTPYPVYVKIYRSDDSLIDSEIINRSGFFNIVFRVYPSSYYIEVCSPDKESIVSGIIQIYSYNDPYFTLKTYRYHEAYPTGVSDYGVYYDSDKGSFVSYSYRADKALGIAILYNFYSKFNYDPISFQLNSIVVPGEDYRNTLMVQLVVAIANISSTESHDRLLVSYTSAIFNVSSLCIYSLEQDSLYGNGDLVGGVRANPWCPAGYGYIYQGYREFNIDKSRYPLIIAQLIEVQDNKINFGLGIYGLLDFQYVDTVVFRKLRNLSISVNGELSSIQPHILEYVMAGPHSLKHIVEPEELNVTMALYTYRGDIWTLPISAWSLGRLTYEMVSNVGLYNYGFGYAEYIVGSYDQVMLWRLQDPDQAIYPGIYILMLGASEPRYYLSTEIGSLSNVIEVDRYERYVLTNKSTEEFGPLKIVRLEYRYERFYSFRVLTINGTEVPQEYIEGYIDRRGEHVSPGWLHIDPSNIASIYINGVEVKPRRIDVGEGLINIEVPLAVLRVQIKDLFGLPIPWGSVSVECRGKVFDSSVTDLYGWTEIMVPLDQECTIRKPDYGLFTQIAIASLSIAVASLIYLLRFRGGKTK